MLNTGLMVRVMVINATFNNKMLLTLRSTRLNKSYSTVSGYDIDSFLFSRSIRYGSGCFFFPFDFMWFPVAESFYATAEKLGVMTIHSCSLGN
jgi:hypothetical protein